MHHRYSALFISTAVLLSLSACGGGGGINSVSANPPPTLPPPPVPAAAPVTIFATPIPETYVTVGVARSATAPNDVFDVFGVLSKADTDQPHIRYSAAGYYEIEMPGSGWTKLIHDLGNQSPTSDNNSFQPSNVAQNQATLVIERARLLGYKYSELASWSVGMNKAGKIAFGSSTPAGAVPVTGSANYFGIVRGTSDITQDSNGFGPNLVDVKGDVTLSFDFGAGTLAGAMTLKTDPYVNPVALGTFAFKNTVFGVGSTTYSGAFTTPASGANYFFGQFTGPAGQELIGAWALPFIYSVDGKTHQAVGGWIAK